VAAIDLDSAADRTFQVDLAPHRVRGLVVVTRAGVGLDGAVTARRWACRWACREAMGTYSIGICTSLRRKNGIVQGGS
jgi:hypothetical protein